MGSLRERFSDLVAVNEHLPPICVTLGMRLVRYGEGRAAFSMAVDRKFYNPMGTVHGGIITDLADASMGVAVISTLEEGEAFTTLELKMNFLRPVFEGKLTAESKVLHRGRTIALVESIVRNDRKVIARGTATQMILKADRPSRRGRT